MNKYIKTNSNNEIIDVFFPYQESKFDGTEIFLEDDPTMKHKINGKSISNEYAIWLFKYIENSVVEKIPSEILLEINLDYLPIYKQQKIDEMTDYILKKLLQWSKAITAIQAQYNNVFIVSVEGAASMAEVDIIYNDMITWLNAP